MAELQIDLGNEFARELTRALGLDDVPGLLGLQLDIDGHMAKVHITRLMTPKQAALALAVLRRYSFSLSVLRKSEDGKSVEQEISPDGSTSAPYPGPEISPPLAGR